MGAVLRFPTIGLGDRPKVSSSVPKFLVEVQELSSEAAGRLLETTKSIIDQSRTLVEYIDHNRDEARTAGVETIGIELSGIMEGGRLGQVKDALEDARDSGGKPEVSIEGFGKLRRAERLLTDANLLLARFPGGRPLGLWRPPSYGLGALRPGGVIEFQAQGLGGAVPFSPRMSGILDLPPAVLILSIVGAGAILALVVFALTRK